MNQVVNQQQGAVSVRQQMAVTLNDAFGGLFSNLGASFKQIKTNNNRFYISEGGSMDDITDKEGGINCVIVRANPNMHCTLYKGKYHPNMPEDDKHPIAIWNYSAEPPASIPKSRLEKGEDGFNQYTIQQRIVILLVRVGPDGRQYIDYDNPYPFDIGSMSVFGDDISYGDNTRAYSLSNYVRYLGRNNANPCDVMTRIIFDTSKRVTVLRFKPSMREGRLNIFPDELAGTIIPICSRPDVVSQCEVRYLDPADQAAAPTTQVSQQTVQTQVVQEQVVQPQTGQGYVVPNTGAHAVQQDTVAAAVQAAEVAQPNVNDLASMVDEVDDVLSKADAVLEQTAAVADKPVLPAEGSSKMASALDDLLGGGGFGG